MGLIDYSNISTYNVSAIKNIDTFAGIFKSIDYMFGIEYLFGIMSLIIIGITLILIFRDYDFKVGIVVSSTVTFLISIIYYFLKFISWTHLVIFFALYVIVLLSTWKWTEE